MTIRSAASLPGHGQEAPLPAFHSFRSSGCRPVVPRISVATALERRLPKTALADDPPRGRILVVTDKAPLALDVQRVLRDAGYRVIGPAASTDEAERLTIGRRPIDGAVVDLQLERGAAAVVADRLASSGVPFMWLTDPLLDPIPRTHGFAPLLTKPFRSEDLIRTLERALSSRHRSRADRFYAVAPPQEVWPRVFPQL